MLKLENVSVQGISYDREYGHFTIMATLTITRNEHTEACHADIWYGPSTDSKETPQNAWSIAPRCTPALTGEEEVALILEIVGHPNFETAKQELRRAAVQQGFEPLSL